MASYRSSSNRLSDMEEDAYHADESFVHQPRGQFFDQILWNSVYAKLSKFKEILEKYSDSYGVFFLRAKCFSPNCCCALKDSQGFIVKVHLRRVFHLASWCKIRFSINSKTNAPDYDKLSKLVLLNGYDEWFEVLNENFEAIPCWNNITSVVQLKPKQFYVRQDLRCLRSVHGVIHSDNVHVLKQGSLLTLCGYRQYVVRKGKKSRNILLAKCTSTNNKSEDEYFISPNEPCFLSPIAGNENITGLHQISVISNKFKLPLNIKPLSKTPPLSHLPSSDRHFLQLNQQMVADLLFLSPLSNPKKMFIITSDMFNDHKFSFGELACDEDPISNPLSFSQQKYITCFQTKVDSFMNTAHTNESLQYLLTHCEDVTNKLFYSKQPLTTMFSGLSAEEEHEIYDQLEDIYFFIRAGYFPLKSKKQCASTKPVIRHHSTKRDGIVDSEQLALQLLPKQEDEVQCYSNQATDDKAEATSLGTSDYSTSSTTSTSDAYISTTSDSSAESSDYQYPLRTGPRSIGYKSVQLGRSKTVECDNRPDLKSKLIKEENNQNVNVSLEDFIQFSTTVGLSSSLKRSKTLPEMPTNRSELNSNDKYQQNFKFFNSPFFQMSKLSTKNTQI